ncbi:hypothetical protein [Burkholderia gladioli]|uniref:hypothetical protein n=1 Tax=Burkholderia gladioli TaxID=28095 RepID=UPI00163E9EFB|nr:hypothetical protein [Burkholderia gladioli]
MDQNLESDEGYRPRWPQEVKELAYKLDPECWVSYSGRPRKFKAYMDSRRTASLEEAERRIARGDLDGTAEGSGVTRQHNLAI